MHQTSKQPDFTKTIGEIKGAKEEYDRLILDAKQQADRILREAKEKISDERSEANERIVKLKNERLRAGSKEIEDEVQRLIKKAKDDSSKVRSEKLGASSVSKLVKEFLKSL